MNALIPELGTAVAILESLQSEDIPFRMAWNRADRIVFWVGDLEIHPMFPSVKVWLNGIGLGPFTLDCGQFVPLNLRLLMVSQK